MQKLCTAALAASLALGACQLLPGSASTGPSVDQVNAQASGFIDQVKAFDQKAASDLQSFNAKGGETVQQLGTSLCGFISMGNGLFSLLAPLASIDAKGQAAEATVIATANLVCPRIAAGAPTITSDVATALEAYQALHTNLQAAAPTVAAAATVSAPVK